MKEDDPNLGFMGLTTWRNGYLTSRVAIAPWASEANRAESFCFSDEFPRSSLHHSPESYWNSRESVYHSPEGDRKLPGCDNRRWRKQIAIEARTLRKFPDFKRSTELTPKSERRCPEPFGKLRVSLVEGSRSLNRHR
jgi:hypothetical protein